MSFLHSTVSIPMGWIVATAIVAAALLALWISTLLSRRWYVTLRKSEETELLGLYLSRMAEALERLSASREAPAQAPVETSERKPVGFSMLGL
jgi:hypothetical protein